ncbi:unnamed protein product [Rotaria socialis]|uniref:Mediator of RNA polymerase II transcription subunit 9 n=1 Tax=Rotaria socialis TaxID=392032 RepID=A0A818V0Q0_9BILA|nr:unnamed protein product [Rotaria socialis]CAF3426540.1 unnamed protein product [Rotaria socialis]CAF3461977.1 unnamed protein product [Rotaria socialis]CAF3677336.1 unnamed protein product [Rotaria socialis]CAF3705485.1 unnamed protein product [Rotaria socialis]
MASASNQSQQQPINYSGDAPTATSSSVTTKSSVTFDEDLFLFLPRLSDILKSFEKNPSELKVKLDELRKQFESCNDMISRVEGIDTTIDSQRSELERLDNELKSKSELLKKHIQMCKFDLNMPPKARRLPSETEQELNHQRSQNPTHAMNINDDDDDNEDDDLFQSDDNTNSHQEPNNESLSSFFS